MASNRELAERFAQTLTDHDLAGFAELLHPDYVNHNRFAQPGKEFGGRNIDALRSGACAATARCHDCREDHFMTPLGTPALALASKGMCVFPCNERSKEPALSGGFKRATTDPNVIRGWWRACRN